MTPTEIKELQTAARADAKRKVKMRALSRKGFATRGRAVVVYYPDCDRFAYFVEGHRVNRSDIEVLP
jgi:hypothetical protein